MQDRVTEMAKSSMFDAGMAKLARAFNVELAPKRAQVYWERLEHYDYEPLKRALELALDNECFFPSIASIRKYIEPLLDPRQPRQAIYDTIKVGTEAEAQARRRRWEEEAAKDKKAGWHEDRKVRGKLYPWAPCPTNVVLGSCACCPTSRRTA